MSFENLIFSASQPRVVLWLYGLVSLMTVLWSEMSSEMSRLVIDLMPGRGGKSDCQASEHPFPTHRPFKASEGDRRIGGLHAVIAFISNDAVGLRIRQAQKVAKGRMLWHGFNDRYHS